MAPSATPGPLACSHDRARRTPRAPARPLLPGGHRIPRFARIAIVCLLAALPLGAAAPAVAAPSQQLVFDARTDVLDPERRAAALDEIKALGADSLRLLVYWRDVAPAPGARSRPAVDLRDPASYSWGQYDAVIAAARDRGLPVLLTLTTPGPKWAMRGRRDFLTYPSASAFGAFVEAAGKRYGEGVDTWAIGNEPNHPDFLRPQWRRGRPVSPRVYRGLYRSATAGLRRSGNGADTVLMGETLPRGVRGRSVTPLAFLRGVLCLDSRYRKRGRCARLRIDGFAHHPYTTRSGPFFVSPDRDDVTIGTLSRLTRALDRAARAGVVRRRLPVWLTEFGVQSSPDRISGVPLARQTEHRALAERLAFHNPRVRAFSQYLLTDDQPVDGVSPRKRYGGFESGLRFATGRDKPALKGFRLPVAAVRRGSRVSVWGLVRTATGPTSVEILVRDRGSRAFRLLKTVRTSSVGAFTTRTAFRRGRRYRLRAEGATGAPARVYTRR